MWGEIIIIKQHTMEGNTLSVPKGKRKESQFEVIKHFYRLRKDITDLLLRDFGYSEKKAKQKLEKRLGGKAYGY